ncbi:MAG: hypothetical protein Q7S33_01975 [Nanoarchaeota archaeon]|nr:hypothetical protein [Nanoarchaeota archaeon]
MEKQLNYLKVLGLENTPLRDLLAPQKVLAPNHNLQVQKSEPTRETKKYDLEERTLKKEPEPNFPRDSNIRAPMHSNPITERFGDYEIKTWGIHENSNNKSYFLWGNLSLSKIRKEKIFGFLPFEKEKVEWQSSIDTSRPSISCELYHPRKIAELIVEDLEKQGIEVNHQKTEELLVIALNPYVNLAKYYCIDLKKCENLISYDKRCKLV